MKAAFTPGSTFAGYRVDSLVGRGGMGVVYRATDLSLERPVALKLIAPELAEDKRFRERFLREPKLAASIDHPNVIPIYEAGEHDGQLYLAMRFVDGQRPEDDPPARRQARAAARAGPAGPGGGGARRRPPPRARAPRREAGERAAGRGRPRLPHRLRDHQAARRRLDRHRPGGGHARLPGARADPRRPRGRAHRLLRARLRALRVPVGQGRRSGAPPRRRRSGRTCRRSRRRCAATRRWIRCSARRSPRTARIATAAAPS